MVRSAAAAANLAVVFSSCAVAVAAQGIPKVQWPEGRWRPIGPAWKRFPNPYQRGRGKNNEFPFCPGAAVVLIARQRTSG